jgi:signal transduction histidine kinase
LTMWTFLLGPGVSLWAAVLGLVTHWVTGLVNGYGTATFTHPALYERWFWLLFGVVGASMVSKGLADGLRAERREREASRRAARAEAEARVLRDAHGGVLPTLASVRHLALAGTDQGPAIVALVHECEAVIRRRIVEWNGGWSELRSGIEDEIAQLRKRRQLAGEPALLIDVVEVGPIPPVAPIAIATLLEAVGEAVRNAARHASASRIVVKIQGTAEVLTVVVRDDGCGFQGREGFGVRHSIREPLQAVGGSARLQTGPGRGTRWEFHMPAARDAHAVGMATHSSSIFEAARSSHGRHLRTRRGPSGHEGRLGRIFA